MDLIVTLIVGGIVGWLASLIMRTDAQMGIVANIVVGIVGSLIGFWLAGALGIGLGNAVARWAVAVLGAVLLIALWRAIAGTPRTRSV
jgi:uncharacterized membrane protein YeaQ/YmgE (transglycosylase-associated protein family)